MATPFIGFEQFAEVQSTPPPPPSANDSTPSNGTKASKSPYDDIEPVYTGGDGDIAVLCKNNDGVGPEMHKYRYLIFDI